MCTISNLFPYIVVKLQLIRTMAQLTILDNLPRFAGARKATDTAYKTSLNVRTFFRSLDNYFAQNNISDNAKKVQVLFAQVEKDHGNAIDLINCYVGVDAKYEDIRQEFLHMYPNFIATDIVYAAKAVLDLDITKPDLFSGMTILEKQGKALVEAYLNNPEIMKDLGIDKETKIKTGTGETEKTVLVLNLLHNFVMQIVMARQLPPKAYEQLSKFTAAKTSTKLMSETVFLIEKENLRKSIHTQKSPEGTNEIAWHLASTAAPPYVRAPAKAKGPSNPYAQGNNNSNNSKACFGCNKGGHFRRECRSSPCMICNKPGHVAKECRNKSGGSFNNKTGGQSPFNQSNGKPKRYCGYCKKTNHNTNDCYARQQVARPPQNNYNKGRSGNFGGQQHQTVRIISEEEIASPDIEYEDESGEDESPQ